MEAKKKMGVERGLCVVLSFANLFVLGCASCPVHNSTTKADPRHQLNNGSRQDPRCPTGNQFALPSWTMRAATVPMPAQVDDCYMTVALTRDGTIAAATSRSTYVLGADQRQLRAVALDCERLLADDNGTGIWCYGARIESRDGQGVVYGIGFSTDAGQTWLVTALPYHGGRSLSPKDPLPMTGHGILAPDNDSLDVWKFAYDRIRNTIVSERIVPPPHEASVGSPLIIDQTSICWQRRSRKNGVIAWSTEAFCSHDRGRQWQLVELGKDMVEIWPGGTVWWRVTRDGKLSMSADKGVSWIWVAFEPEHVFTLVPGERGAFVFDETSSGRRMLRYDAKGRWTGTFEAPPLFHELALTTSGDKVAVGSFEGVMLFDGSRWRAVLPPAVCERGRRLIERSKSRDLK